MWTSTSGRPTRAVAVGTLATALASGGLLATAFNASADSAPATSQRQVGKVVDVGAVLRATCNYQATVKINRHVAKDRSSRVLDRYPAGTQFLGAPCTNERGGNYGSCGTGNIWKNINGGWVATKCLVRI